LRRPSAGGEAAVPARAVDVFVKNGSYINCTLEQQWKCELESGLATLDCKLQTIAANTKTRMQAGHIKCEVAAIHCNVLSWNRHMQSTNPLQTFRCACWRRRAVLAGVGCGRDRTGRVRAEAVCVTSAQQLECLLSYRPSLLLTPAPSAARGRGRVCVRAEGCEVCPASASASRRSCRRRYAR